MENIVYFGIILVIIFTVVRADPLCRYKIDESNQYSCTLTEGSIFPPIDNVNITGAHETGKNSSHVTRLYSSETATNFILELVFDEFPNLESLEFPFGTFENISGHFLKCAKLKKLQIKKGLFKAVPAKTFEVCSLLEELDLGANAINSLDKESFAGLVNLKKLLLDSNQISTIPSSIFDGLENLVILDISGNTNLRTLNNDLFKNNANLEELLMASTKVLTLKKEYFNGLTKLIKLNATGCQINATEEAIFDEKLTALRTALFKSNECIDEDIENFQLSSDKSKFQTCINNFNGSSYANVSRIFFLLLPIVKFFW